MADLLNEQEISKKFKSKYGVDLTKSRILPGVVSTLISVGSTIGLTSGAAILSPILFWTGVGLGTVIGGGTIVSLTANAIRDRINYKSYKTLTDPTKLTLTKEQEAQIQRAATKEDRYSLRQSFITDKLINHAIHSTIDGDGNVLALSLFDKAMLLHKKYENTKNPFKKLKYHNQALTCEDGLNKILKSLLERLNELSILKKNKKANLNAQIEEMQKIQTFIATILNKTIDRDAYFTRLKNYLKSHSNTIELITVEESHPAYDFVQKDVNDMLKTNVKEAIKNFCNYTKKINSLNKHTSLGTQLTSNLNLHATEEASYKAQKSLNRTLGYEQEAAESARKARTSATSAKLAEIDAQGSADRSRKYEEYLADMHAEYDKIITACLESDKKTHILISAFETTYAKAKTNSREIANILNKMREGRKTQKQVVKKSQRTAQKQYDDMVELLDKLYKLMDDTDIDVNIFKRNLKAEFSKYTTEMNKELDKSKKTNEVIGEELAKAETARKEVEVAKFNAEQDAEYIEELREEASDIIKELAKNTSSVSKIVKELKSLNVNDVKNLIRATKKSAHEIALLWQYIARLENKNIDIDTLTKDIQKSFRAELTKASNDASMEVEACYEFLGREIANIYNYLRDNEYHDLARPLEEQVTWLQRDIANLQADKVLLAAQLEEVNAKSSYNPSILEKQEEEEEEEKYTFPKSQDEIDAEKRFKSYIHAVYRATKSGERLPETEPKVMKGKKQTQLEIREAAGKNIDFSPKGKIMESVNEICDQYLTGKDKAKFEELAKKDKLDATEQLIYIGLIQKACKKCNHTLTEFGM